MAKLYAELTSDKGGRVASIGGDKFIQVTFCLKNKTVRTFRLHDWGDSIELSEHDKTGKTVQITKLT